MCFVMFLIIDIRDDEELQDVENLLGIVVCSEEGAYKLYNDYAIQIGFSVRKEKLRYAKNGVRQREYVCSKEGFPRDGDRLDDKKFKRLQTRIGCKASIRFTVTNGEWKVTHFNPNHNHEFAKPEQRPFLRSNRKITDAQLGVIRIQRSGHKNSKYIFLFS